MLPKRAAAMLPWPLRQALRALKYRMELRAGLLHFHAPQSPDGLPNYFQARATTEGGRAALCLALDELPLPHKIALLKIDVEQHEVAVLRGMRNLLSRDLPIVVIEAHEGVYGEFFREHGDRMLPKALGSPNLVFLPPDGHDSMWAGGQDLLQIRHHDPRVG